MKKFTGIAARQIPLFVVLSITAAFLTASLPAPVYAQGRGGKAIEKFDKNGDGMVSRDEWRKSGAAFEKIDGDGDGQLTAEEFKAFFAARSGQGGSKEGGRKKKSNPAPAPTPAAGGQATQAGKMPADFPQPYFVDAHSQMSRDLDPDIVIGQMNKAGVWHTILSARNDRNPDDVADFAANHPGRITASVRSKGRAFNDNKPKLRKLLGSQLRNPIFKAMAEAILYHAQKGNKAPEIIVEIDSPPSIAVLDATLERGWPFIAHYELAAAGSDAEGYLKSFEDIASKYPDHPFVLIHMAQMEPGPAAALLKAHPNVYFLTSHSNSVNISAHPGQPWTNLFYSEKFNPEWKKLIIAYPDRFILAFDNVWAQFWGDLYLEQAAFWRKALKELPPDVAAAVAHGNAERLWKLPVPGR